MKRLLSTIGMRAVSIATLVLVLSLFSVAHAGWINKDLYNQGPDAHDVAVVLEGIHDIPAHFDGYHVGPTAGWFDSFTASPDGGNTLLHWQLFSDGTDNIIQNGQTVHVGWYTHGDVAIRDMYWTDASGQRIPESVIYNITTGWGYGSTDSTAHPIWENEFHTAPIQISNVHFAVLDVAVPLEELNAENTSLLELLAPLPGGEDLTVEPGALVTLDIPGILPGDWIVLRFDVTGPGSSAQTVDYVETQISSSIPTFTEWGFIIFGALLLGSIVFYVWRRRQAPALA